jgi:hypothetical protein
VTTIVRTLRINSQSVQELSIFDGVLARSTRISYRSRVSGTDEREFTAWSSRVYGYRGPQRVKDFRHGREASVSKARYLSGAKLLNIYIQSSIIPCIFTIFYCS